MEKKYKITKYNYRNEKITGKLCIVMIADLHNQQYGRNNEELLFAIRREHPDMIVLPGDMIVCQSSEYENNSLTADTIRRMAEIAPVYYAYGNHERGLREGARGTNPDAFCSYEKRLSKCNNIRMLVNSHAMLSKFNICLYGLNLSLDYYSRIFMKPLEQETLHHLLGYFDEERCNILLAHNPDYFRAYSGIHPDLVLSGHNHGGMIRLPVVGGLISPRLHLFPKYDYGMYTNKEKTTSMIVSGGCGMHSIPIRINNPPELVVIHVNYL